MKLETKRCKKVFKIIKKILKNSKSQDPAHDLSHLLRVWKFGIIIGKKKKANLGILEPSLLLHDLFRPSKGNTEKNHAEISAFISEKILAKCSYTTEEINKITSVINSHSRTKKSKKQNKCLEAKILYDADKLDGIGVVGCVRAAMLCSRKGLNFNQMVKWYLNRIMDVIKNEPFYTKEAKKLSKNKINLSLNFCRDNLGNNRSQNIIKKYKNKYN